MPTCMPAHMQTYAETHVHAHVYTMAIHSAQADDVVLLPTTDAALAPAAAVASAALGTRTSILVINLTFQSSMSETKMPLRLTRRWPALCSSQLAMAVLCNAGQHMHANSHACIHAFAALRGTTGEGSVLRQVAARCRALH